MRSSQSCGRSGDALATLCEVMTFSNPNMWLSWPRHGCALSPRSKVMARLSCLIECSIRGKLGSWSRLQSSKEILSPTWRLARRQLPRLLARRRQPWWWKVRRIRRRKPRWTRSHRLLRRPRNQSSRLSIGWGPEIGEVELPWEEGCWCAFAGKHIQLQDHIPEWALLAVEQGWGWSLWLRGVCGHSDASYCRFGVWLGAACRMKVKELL